MGSIALLLAGTLLAVPPETGRPLPLRLERGQEFIYHGRYTREGGPTGAEFTQGLVTYVFILEATPQGSARAAFMTEQRVTTSAGVEAVPVVRLETGRIDTLGRVTLDRSCSVPCLPIEAPPTLETYPFVELPTEFPPDGRGWETLDLESGPIQCKPLGKIELREKGRCLNLQRDQTSGPRNRAGALVWRRSETVSVLLREGYVDHVERDTKWRTASGDGYKSTIIVDLESCPAPMGPGDFNNRRFEINEALKIEKKLADLKDRGVPNDPGFDELLKAIDRHDQRGTPYGLAIKSLRRRVELARSGVRPPEPIIIRVENQKPAPKPAEVGQPAPNLTLRELSSGASLSLASLRGKPAVLVFFEASAGPDDHVVRYIRAAARDYAGRVHVAPLLISGDAGAAERLRLPGGAYDARPVLEALGRSGPCAIVFDGFGVIRFVAPGWRPEYRDLLHEELVKTIRGQSK